MTLHHATPTAAAAQDPAIRFEDLRKKFGEFVALESFSLDVAAGEFMVLVGPSGSGKTTALRDSRRTRGDVGWACVDRRSLRRPGTTPRPRRSCCLPRLRALPTDDGIRQPRLRVKDASGPPSEIEARVQRAAEMLDLHVLLKRKPSQLSGQKQRVALGRALVREPQAFLMDEPLSNLDAQLRAQTRGEIKRLQQRLGTTTIYVTHDQVEAMTMGDRIAVLYEGKLQQVASPSVVYEFPKTCSSRNSSAAPQ